MQNSLGREIGSSEEEEFPNLDVGSCCGVLIRTVFCGVAMATAPTVSGVAMVTTLITAGLSLPVVRRARLGVSMATRGFQEWAPFC